MGNCCGPSEGASAFTAVQLEGQSGCDFFKTELLQFQNKHVSGIGGIASNTVFSAEELSRIAGLLNKAYETIVRGGVALLPTTVGYTLTLTQDGIPSAERVKQRPTKTFGVLGSPEVFKAVHGPVRISTQDFQRMLEQDLPDDLCLAFLRICDGAGGAVKVPERCLDAGGGRTTVSIWMNLGFPTELLGLRLLRERGELLLGTSANISGEGNPTSPPPEQAPGASPAVKAVRAEYSLASVTRQIVEECDLVVPVATGDGLVASNAIKHWTTPDMDSENRWLSAPIFDLDSRSFHREGRMQEQCRQWVEGCGLSVGEQ